MSRGALAEEVAREKEDVLNSGGVVQLYYNHHSMEWLFLSNATWMAIYSVIANQLDTEGFNFGPTNRVCWFLRKLYIVSELPDNIV